MTAPDFIAYPKTPRLFRHMVITEQIDGTNAGIIITDDGDVWAQSRNRLLTPPSDTDKGTDNAGFRAWVDEHRNVLRHVLGVGRHYGEWWGKGIQRGYDRPGKTFSLFNVARWNNPRYLRSFDIGLDVVPVLYEDVNFDTQLIQYAVDELAFMGSVAAPGFMNPEGICVWHDAARQVFKVTVEHDAVAKGQVATPRPVTALAEHRAQRAASSLTLYLDDPDIDDDVASVYRRIVNRTFNRRAS